MSLWITNAMLSPRRFYLFICAEAEHKIFMTSLLKYILCSHSIKYVLCLLDAPSFYQIQVPLFKVWGICSTPGVIKEQWTVDMLQLEALVRSCAALAQWKVKTLFDPMTQLTLNIVEDTIKWPIITWWQKALKLSTV